MYDNIKLMSQKGFAHILVLLMLLVAVGATGIVYYKNAHEPVVSTPQVYSLPLSLDSPADGALITDDRIALKGRTKPNTTVAFYSDIDENSVESDSYGNFEGSIGLAEGINPLTVTAFDENGNEKSLAVDIVNDSSN